MDISVHRVPSIEWAGRGEEVSIATLSFLLLASGLDDLNMATFPCSQ